MNRAYNKTSFKSIREHQSLQKLNFIGKMKIKLWSPILPYLQFYLLKFLVESNRNPTLEDCTRKRISWKLIVFIYRVIENLKYQLRKPGRDNESLHSQNQSWNSLHINCLVRKLKAPLLSTRYFCLYQHISGSEIYKLTVNCWISQRGLC